MLFAAFNGQRLLGVGVSKDEALAVARERYSEQFVLAQIAEQDAELIFMIGLDRYRPFLGPDGFIRHNVSAEYADAVLDEIRRTV